MRPKAGSCGAIGWASRSSRRATSCASLAGRSSPTVRRGARRGPARQLVQRSIAQAHLVEMGDRVLDIDKVGAGGAAAAADQRQSLGKRQLACELPVLPIGEIDPGVDRPAILEMDRPDRLLLDAVVVDLAMDQ